MINQRNPTITVLMPVFNAAQFVAIAIKSVVRQSFGDFEFIIIDDGSIDNSVSLVESISDERIRLIVNGKNRGVAWTLNHGLNLARGSYIVRMDADDICYPDRLKKQLYFMESNPKIGIAGSWVKYFGNQPPVVERLPLGSDVVKAFMLFDNPIFHPSVIMRKEYLDRYNLRYDPQYNRSEDFDLWLRASENFDLDNIEEPLLKFRCHEASVTNVASEVMKKQACDLLGRGFKKLKLSLSDEEMLFHYTVSKGHPMNSAHELLQAEEWLNRLIQRNDRIIVYEREAFRKVVAMIWYRLCQNSAHLGLVSWKMSKGALAKGFSLQPLSVRLRFLLSIFWHKHFTSK